MKKVVIESPFRGNIFLNRAYLQAAVLHSLSLGEAPYASHAFYTHFLDDAIEDERWLGIHAGLAWGQTADLVAVYEDFGISDGMRYGICIAKEREIPIQHRKILQEDRLCLQGFDHYKTKLEAELLFKCDNSETLNVPK